MSTNNVIKKVAMNGPIKDLTTSISSFLIKMKIYKSFYKPGRFADTVTLLQ